MSDINTIKTKLDTDNQKWVISEKEFNDNFGKLNQEDYKKISEWLEAKDQQFLTLLQKPIFENLQKKDLLNKQSLSVNELKTTKLFFMSYGMNANRNGAREKSNEQKMAEMYMNEKWIFYGLWQDWWNEFKKWFKWNVFNFNKSKGKDINYPAWPINTTHPDIKWLNNEWLQITQQIEQANKNIQNNIQQSMKNIENKEIATRPLSKKLEELKNNNTLDALDELTSAPNGILYNDNIKEMTYNEKEKIQKIIENVFNNPSISSNQVMDYVWKFHCSLWDEKWSNKTWKKIEWSSLWILVDNQVGMRIEIMNTCYQLAQAKCYGDLQTKPENAKTNLVKLCNILTWRFNSTGKGRMMQEDNDKKFNNPELARGVLENLMQINGTIDKISPVDLLKDEPTLKNKECWSFVAEISQNIPRPLSWEFGILDLVSVDEKIKISQLSPTLQARAIVLKKISEKIKSDQKQVPFDDVYIQELKNFWTNEAKVQQTKFEIQKKKFKEEITGKSWNWIGIIKYTSPMAIWIDAIVSGVQKWNNYKFTQEFELQWADEDILALYRDFAVNNFWAGQLSDEVDDQVMWYAKMWAMIWWTIVTMMIFPPAWVGYLWSAIAVWVTSTVLTQVLYQKMNYESFAEWAVDIGSQFVFDTATAFLGMKVFWPIVQKVPWFFNNVKNITSNVWFTLFDVTIWASAEWMRQMWINELFDKQENVDILQMIRAWWVMATVFLMVSWWFHVKLPVDDMLRHLKANDPKINPNGFKSLDISEIDYQNSIKLLELKSNALKDVNIANQKTKTNIESWNIKKYSQNEIEANSILNDVDRLAKAEKIVWPLNEIQRKWVIDMHNSTVHKTPEFVNQADVWSNVREIWIDFADWRWKYSVQGQLIDGKRYELWPNGEIAWVNNLTKEQKLNKQLIWEKSWLDKDKHIVPLMDSWICGTQYNLDWTKYGKISENKKLMDEYLDIEIKAKSDGTWMKRDRDYDVFSDLDEMNLIALKERLKNNDLNSRDKSAVESIIATLENRKIASVTYDDTPYAFVIERSSAFLRAYPNGFNKTYRGTGSQSSFKGRLTDDNTKGAIFTADKKSAIDYACGSNKIFTHEADVWSGIHVLYYPKSKNILEIDAKWCGWRDIDVPWLGKMSTDNIAKYIEDNNIDYAKITNVFDGVLIKEEIIFNHKKGNYLKSAIGNTGFFDMGNPNIYKSLFPLIVGYGAYQLLQDNNKEL